MHHRIQIGHPVTLGQPTPSQRSPRPASGSAFGDLLDSALTQPVKLSVHAQERLALSRRELTEADLRQIAQAVDRAAQKGSRDALILMRDLALVVSVKNRTVITAVAGDRVKENLFTNIDSAVIL